MLLPGLLGLVTGMLSGSGLWGGDGNGDGGLSLAGVFGSGVRGDNGAGKSGE